MWSEGNAFSPSHVRIKARELRVTHTGLVSAKASEPHDCPPGLPPL